MHRLAPILLLGGALLFATGLQAPAAPPPVTPDETRAALEQTLPVMTEVTAQVERLRERTSTAPQFPPPERDPFRFGRRATMESDIPVVTEPEPVLMERGPDLPRLIAVVESKTEQGVTYRAVLSVGETITVVAAGDVAGSFTVRTIAAGTVEVVDSATSRSYQLSLR